MISLIGLAAVLASGNGLAESDPVMTEEDFKIPLWDYSGAVRGGFGYKDNILLSSTNAQGSAFWMSSGEVMVFRLPTRGWQFTVFADASDTRYFNAPDVDNEQVALAVSQLSKDFGRGWKSTLGLNYMFQNQVFDNSANYTNENSVGLILGHTLTPRWSARKTWGPLWVEGELSGTRQWLEAPLDSYWQFGPRAVIGYRWGRGSELAFSYRYARLNYDDRTQVDSAGAPLPNTRLALNTQIAELSLAQVWDQKRRWETSASAGLASSLDDGSGFYDYTSCRVSGKARYHDEKWEVAAQAGSTWYDYATQTVSTTDTALRRKTMLTLSVRAERKLTGHLMVHASYNWDRSLSNLDFDDYGASTVLGGLTFTF